MVLVFFVIQNLSWDLGFGSRICVLVPRSVGKFFIPWKV
jgi:hypothetical protein